MANEAEKVADIAENKGDFNKANLLRTRAKELRQVAQAGLASETADLDKQRKLINGGVEVEDEEDPKQPQQPSNSENNTAEDDKHNKDAETQYDAPQKDGTKKSTNSRQPSDINDSDSSDDGQNDPNNNDNKSNQTGPTKDVKGNNKDSDTSNNNTDNKSSTDNEDDDKKGAGPDNPPTNQKNQTMRKRKASQIMVSQMTTKLMAVLINKLMEKATTPATRSIKKRQMMSKRTQQIILVTGTMVEMMIQVVKVAHLLKTQKIKLLKIHLVKKKSVKEVLLSSHNLMLN